MTNGKLFVSFLSRTILEEQDRISLCFLLPGLTKASHMHATSNLGVVSSPSWFGLRMPQARLDCLGSRHPEPIFPVPMFLVDSPMGMMCRKLLDVL